MPVSSSIHWKPLRDPHYVLASLERGQGGRRQLFIKQAVLVRVQALARGAYGQRIAGLLIGRRYECPITGTSYVLIESLAEAQPAPDDASLAHTIRALAAQFHGHDLESVGWFCSEPTVDDRLAKTPATIHLASFPEPWQTVLVVDDRGTGGVFFLRDAPAARWFPSPFYEQIEPTRNHQPTKPTSVSWPEYLTMDTVVPLPPPEPIARSVRANAAPVSPPAARSPSQRVASTGSPGRSLRRFISRIVSLSRLAWSGLVTAFARLRPRIAHGSSAVGDSLISFRKTTADRASALTRGSVGLIAQAKDASTKVVEREIARRAEAARARQVEAEAQRVRQEAERARQEEAERTRRAVAEAERARQEAERERRAEAERARRAEVERARREEAERVRQLQAERAREAEAEQARRAEAERVARVEAERVRQEAAARARQAEAERMRQAEAERAQKAEAEHARRAEAERVRQIELERARQIELERARQAEEERAQLAAIGRAQQAEEERARLARTERARVVEIERARVAEIERARVAAEAERARVAETEGARVAAEAERARVAAETERARVAAETERARVAAEAERARRAAAEQSSRKNPLPIPESPRSRGTTGLRPVTTRLTDKQMALAATVTATQLADLEDTTHMDRPYRYLALAAREGFVVVTKSDGGDSDRSEFWVLEDPDAHILLTVVTSDRWVREAAIHYNVHTEDESLLRGTPPEHRDLESGTIYVCESAVDQLRARCRRLRASGRLVREWKVAPPIDLPLPFRTADGATVSKPAPDGQEAHPASRSSQA